MKITYNPYTYKSVKMLIYVILVFFTYVSVHLLTKLHHKILLYSFKRNNM